MIDVQGLPPPTRCDVQVFKTISNSVNDNTVWSRPSGISMCHIFVLGGGGGGGGGFSAASGNARGGGGGGGSAGPSSLLVPAMFLPKTLLVKVGAGGAGVTSPSSGFDGSNSSVSVDPFAAFLVVSDYLLYSSGGGGGNSGTGAAAGTGGTAAAAALASIMPCARLGVSQLSVGKAGSDGGVQTGAVGVASNIDGNTLVMGGAGGAGTQSANFAGGSIPNANSSIFEQWRPAAPASGSNKGSDGPTLWEPFFSYCGLGGSSNNTGAGGVGGRGGHGAGGGGGGAGTSSGLGGDGGSGLVIIVSW